MWFRDFKGFTVPGLQGSGVFEVKDEKSMVFFLSWSSRNLSQGFQYEL